MKIEIEKLPKNEVKLKIELTYEEMKPYLEKAAFLISQKTKIPGFRPGKAPFEIVKSQIGEEKILQEALEHAVQKTFTEAIRQEKLITIGSPKIDILKVAPNNPFIYAATISLLPKVELGEYKNIKMKAKKVEVSKEEEKKAIKNLQKMRNKEVLVEREAKAGDKVEIDFKTLLAGVPIEHGEQKKYPIVIGEKTFIPGFEDNLVGLKAGQEKKFALEFPKEYHDKKLAGKECDFEVKVNAVYEITLPELNDEFAKGVGNFKNLDDLKKQMHENLEKEAKHKAEHDLEDEMIEKLVEVSKVEDIPELLITTEAKKMLSELEQNISQQGIQFDDYLTHLKKKREDLLLDFTPNAVKRVKSALVIREVGQKEKIEVTSKDIEAEINAMLTSYPDDPKIKEQVNSESYKDYLRNVIASRKVIELLKKEIIHPHTKS